jgi:hypothetical protein
MVKYTCPDAATVTLKTLPVQQGTVVEITHASIMDYTTVNKKMIIGIEDSMGNVNYVTVLYDSTYMTPMLSGNVFLEERERMIGTVVTPTTSDVLYFTVHGRIYDARKMSQ